MTWQWNAATGTYLRSYSGHPDKLLDGAQTAATNVVIMTVPTATGPWVENSEGGHEVDVTATGTGPGGGHAQRCGHHRHLEPRHASPSRPP